MGVIGAGEQGRAQLNALAVLRRPVPVQLFDVDAAAATALAEHARIRLDLPGSTSTSAAQVAAKCDVLLVATSLRSPVLTAGTLNPGTHVTSLGADEPGELELEYELMADALVVTDDQELATAVLPRTGTTLGEVLRGEHPGRQTEDEITVYSPLGRPL